MWPERVRDGPRGQVGGDRSKDVAAVKGVRNLRMEILPILNFEQRFAFKIAVYPGENSVIRSQHKLSGVSGQEYSSPRAHAGINNDDVNRTRREPGEGMPQDKRRVVDILRLDFVRDVHNAGARDDAQDNALHGPDVMIVQAEVCGERYQSHCRFWKNAWPRRLARLVFNAESASDQNREW